MWCISFPFFLFFLFFWGIKFTFHAHKKKEASFHIRGKCANLIQLQTAGGGWIWNHDMLDVLAIPSWCLYWTILTSDGHRGRSWPGSEVFMQCFAVVDSRGYFEVLCFQRFTWSLQLECCDLSLWVEVITLVRLKNIPVVLFMFHRNLTWLERVCRLEEVSAEVSDSTWKV